MGVPEGVVCRVEVLDGDGALLDEAYAGKLGKEHRLRRTVPGDRVTVPVTAHHESDAEGELSSTRTVVLTGTSTTWSPSGSVPAGTEWPEWTPASCPGNRRPDAAAVGC